RGSASVAAHGGEDEGPGPAGLELVHGGPNDGVDVGDTAAARAHRHGVPRLDGETGRAEGLPHTPRDIGEPGAGELPTHAKHPRKGHGRMIRRARHPVNLLDFAEVYPYLSRHMRVPSRARSVSLLLTLALLLGGCSSV